MRDLLLNTQAHQLNTQAHQLAIQVLKARLLATADLEDPGLTDLEDPGRRDLEDQGRRDLEDQGLRVIEDLLLDSYQLGGITQPPDLNLNLLYLNLIRRLLSCLRPSKRSQ